MDDKLYNYVCKVLKWVDGDTLKVEIDLGFDIRVTKTIRVYGINTQEMHAKDKTLAIKALHYAQRVAPVSGYIRVKTHKASKAEEKYGRWLADITLADDRSFADVMIQNELAVPYFGGKR